MSPKQWLALFCFYISYLFFGASVFYHIEHELEAQNRAIDLQHRIDINEILVKYTAPNETEVQNEILRRVSDYCGKPVTDYSTDTYIEPLRWSFYHAFFFSFTVCSTVGYGNITPSNSLGRIFMIFYALIGIPVNGFLFAYLGDFFGKVFLTAFDRYKAYKEATTKNYVPHQLGLIAQIILYLIPGIVIFLFLPSMIFAYFEDWSFTSSMYYSFVTLSTIGFGDYVPTFASQQEEKYGFMFHVYEVFIIFWFIFGLGYLVMIMGFIAKGLRSKHLTRLEHQLAENIKATQSRIWNGVTKDVSYLRRILNEVYIMKFKSGYAEDEEDVEYHSERRSSSCPDLTIYRASTEPVQRKRAQSLFYSVDDDDPDLLHDLGMHRVSSDGDISRVDRSRAFDTTSPLVQPTELLARVFTALGTIKAVDDEAQSMMSMGMGNGGGGIHGFSDSQILASERKNSKWSLSYSETGFAVPPPRGRNRAASDCRAPNRDNLYERNPNEWTWNGTNAQIEEFTRLRKLNKRKSEDLYRASFALPKKDIPFVINIDDTTNQPTPSSATASAPPQSSPSLLHRLNPFKKRDDSSRKTSPIPDRTDIQNYLSVTSAGRESRSMTNQAKRRASVFSILSTTDESNADVLENTTIADLIRALEVVHTQAVTGVDAPLLQELLDDPKRRTGNTGLSQAATISGPPQHSNPLPLINIFPSSPTQMRSRRGSMRPFSSTTNTPVFDRMHRRRQSTILDFPSNRRASFLAPPGSEQPPPYSTTTATPRTTHRRFSVRPTLLSIPPGQSPMPSVQASSSLQRRLSMRPSPLLTDNRLTNRYGRSISTGSSNYSISPLEVSPIPRNRFLSPVDETRSNMLQNRRRSLLSDTITRRKRCESK